MLEAIRKNESALCFASKELQGNRDVVLEAVQQQQQQDVLACASAALKVGQSLDQLSPPSLGCRELIPSQQEKIHAHSFCFET